MFDSKSVNVCVIGLGYVGLPLAVEFAKKFPVLGYDINKERIEQLQQGLDETNEVSKYELQEAVNLSLTYEDKDLKLCNVYIVTVPTPVDGSNKPDFNHLIQASELVAKTLSNGDTVIFESTVYPGATEEICVPILEKYSGMKYNVGFVCGYSPERINPGDKELGLSNIVKITSGSTPSAAKFIDDLYQSIIHAGTHPVKSIKVAEAAKVIENTQRDINIALVNELAMIFHKLNIDTKEVLDAANTKWNFLDFRPGLVGGHCIGVDPYYLAHKAQLEGFDPEIILSGRKVNNYISTHIVNRIIKSMIMKNISIPESKILIMGITFKENCPDTRNSRVLDVIGELSTYGCEIEIFDPWVDRNPTSYPLHKDTESFETTMYNAVVVTVAHEEFRSLGIEFIKKIVSEKHVIFDVKSILDEEYIDDRL